MSPPETATHTDSAIPMKPNADTGSVRLRPWRDATRLAFAPLLFHAVCLARDKGMILAVERAGREGTTAAEIAAQLGLSTYAATVLLDGGVAAGVFNEQQLRYRLTRTGWLIEHEPMTRANMDFSRDVCDRAMPHLGEALATGTPAGLKELVDAPTVYAGLLRLPQKALESWLGFDHYYSDLVFDPALEILKRYQPKKLLDVGGNTGKFALKAADVAAVTVLDHPAQIERAKENAAKAGKGSRVFGVAMDLLDHSRAYPGGFDAVWMSQFLCCFPLGDVEQLLARAKAALAPGGRVWINETFIDRQPNDVARDAVMATSLYFTAVANGTSCMYRQTDFEPIFRRVGLAVDSDHELPPYHTLLALKPV